MSHPDHDTTAPMRDIFIASFHLLFISSLTPPNTYISAPMSMTPRLIYPTKERRLLVIATITPGISLKAIFPWRSRALSIPFPYLSWKNDLWACTHEVPVTAQRKRILIIRMRERWGADRWDILRWYWLSRGELEFLISVAHVSETVYHTW